MYVTICEIDYHSNFFALSRALRVSALGQPRGMGWGGRLQRDLGKWRHVHLWLIHVIA